MVKEIKKIASKWNGKSDHVNTWPFDLRCHRYRIALKFDIKLHRETAPL